VDVDLEVRPGEVRALLRENGAGKSPLVNILAGVITDHEGTIGVAGRPTGSAVRPTRRRPASP
jgi:ribose transport system ATP-binding protein